MQDSTRRTVLAMGGALAMGANVQGTAKADPLGLPLGVQLWAVKAELDQDFDGTLRRLADIGYRRVEAAGYHGLEAVSFRRSVERAGLVCGGTLVGMADLIKDPQGQVGYARDLGAGWLVCSSPVASGRVAPSHPGEDWIDQMRRAMTREDWLRNADLLNQMGARAKVAGLQFAYHSNVFEFSHYDGVEGFETLQKNTDPGLVKTELDVAWAVAGGQDPVALLRRYPDRIKLLHIKDLRSLPVPGRPADYKTVPVGTGVIDWLPIFAEARRTGVVADYVEQEPPFSPVFEQLAVSYRYLHGL